MKIHAQEILKRNIVMIVCIVTSAMCLLMVAVNFKTLATISKPIIIGIDSNGTRIVSEQNDPIYKTEATAFIQRFTYNVYNFSTENFIKRLGVATTMMSEDLWKRKRSEIIDLRSKIERDETALTGKLLKLTLDDTGAYHGLIDIEEKSRLNVQRHKIEVAIKLKTVPRSSENPTGMEIDSYEENIIRN